MLRVCFENENRSKWSISDTAVAWLNTRKQIKILESGKDTEHNEHLNIYTQPKNLKNKQVSRLSNLNSRGVLSGGWWDSNPP